MMLNMRTRVRLESSFRYVTAEQRQPAIRSSLHMFMGSKRPDMDCTCCQPGTCYFLNDYGAFQAYAGLPPEATFGRVKTYLLHLEGHVLWSLTSSGNTLTKTSDVRSWWCYFSHRHLTLEFALDPLMPNGYWQCYTSQVLKRIVHVFLFNDCFRCGSLRLRIAFNS